MRARFDRQQQCITVRPAVNMARQICDWVSKANALFLKEQENPSDEPGEYPVIMVNECSTCESQTVEVPGQLVRPDSAVERGIPGQGIALHASQRGYS